MSDFSGKPYARKILTKMQAFCARQERCVSEIKKKLDSIELPETEKEQIIQCLKDENFLNESRYAEAFVRDKFRLNHWGRIKITYALRQKNIESTCIEKALTIIDDDMYNEIIDHETSKLIRQKGISNTFNDKARLARTLQSKGFEPDIIFSSINRIIQSLSMD